ncbi:uncharacterized protein LY89DRAFT_225664 [Mollisia scopiformis]|uniref:Uncharacterized protein n=1 Tax=Mollisia scopiformis TaxID=149040 RepID=A0A194WU11_MOLSC|nr:uncharacterized protein LY89DRAFT_225664 [Mollisia scopiformis]KUJ11441.1 hypothetical protein LY89DRAFT_225664 [Mollisia scopiformis]
MPPSKRPNDSRPPGDSRSNKIRKLTPEENLKARLKESLAQNAALRARMADWRKKVELQNAVSRETLKHAKTAQTFPRKRD